MISSGLCDGGGEGGVYRDWDPGTQTGQRAKEHGAWVGRALSRATSQT